MSDPTNGKYILQCFVSCNTISAVLNA